MPGALVAGIAHFRTVSEALDAAPAARAEPWKILIREGIYREKLELSKANIHLEGEGPYRSRIVFDAFAGQIRPNYQQLWTTPGSATLTVRAPGCAFSNLTIANDYDYLTNDVKPETDLTRTNDPQAVALFLTAGSDALRATNVYFEGFQDTLFVDAGRSYFDRCSVSGNVDFIFGAGQALFERCTIVSRPRKKKNIYPIGYISAPSTSLSTPYGLIFLRCDLAKESDLIPARSVALGRPWHPAKQFADGRYADPDAVGSSIFLHCHLADHITTDGWFSMTGLQKRGSNRTVFEAGSGRFFEFENSGPGASFNAPRRQLSIANAALLMKWIDATQLRSDTISLKSYSIHAA